MSNRGAWKNIASGLLGTFTSRNNDIDGYWGLGILRLFAYRLKLSTLTLDLLNRSLNLLPESPVSYAEEIYQKWLRSSLKKSKIDISEVIRADINLRFSTFEEFPGVPRDTRGEPYVCTVTIVRRGGYTYSATKVGCCALHDPRKDRRSTRVT
ncbi:MAG TPA: hypothetical protein VL325_02870 [Pyrinomonadaceae bacterium]|jgi:hypothetical protein|nr:hypothetical protein [Pyrinomonadaceae bacterium]